MDKEENGMKTREDFYNNVANILGIAHEYVEPVERRTRWNNRLLGNGRFPGFGLVRCFGSKIMITSKKGTHVFDEYEEVYKYLRNYVLV